ncbi:MAG: sensor histidine kinase [Halanaerobiaceae bacterium]
MGYNNVCVEEQKDNSYQVISISTDDYIITEELIREQEENSKVKQDEIEFDKLKKQFFANLSHEFKTPLNIIFSSINMMDYYIKHDQNYRNDKKLALYLETARRSSYRLLRLIDNLIDLTKIDADSFDLNFEKCDIVLLTTEIANSVASYMEKINRTFTYNIDVEKEEIICDPVSIERILLNLFSNAVKFTEKNDKIHLKLFKKNNKIIIMVKDTGIGIKERDKEKIFEKFRQVDKSFTRHNEGCGLGLALVKSLVNLHHGNISVNSTYGQGSEFIIKLPISGQKKVNYNVQTTANNLISKTKLEFSDIYF